MPARPRSVAALAGFLALSSALPPVAPAPPAPPPAETPGKESGEPESPLAGPARKDPPWGLPGDLLEKLSKVAEVYRDYALRLSCVEAVRAATYGDSGEAEKEVVRRYAFLLYRDVDGKTLRELRQRIRSDGTIGSGEVRDEEPFPPAYAWVDLFSRFYQPFFAYRDRGERFEGYDWVREIEFRGALPFTDGKDIREWEGTVLLDAQSGTPLEIRAQPGGQDDRLRILFDRWSRSFRFLGIRLAPRPFGYKCRVEFRTRKDGLTFPTQLRYDTFRAVSAKQRDPWRASIRDYDEYRFFRVEEEDRLVAPTRN